MNVPGDYGEQFAELAREEVGDLLRLLDEVEVATAGLGHPGEKLLIEVSADAECARPDARAG